MQLKIGRHLYEVDHTDQFLDNKACIQLITQHVPGTYSHNGGVSPVLSKAAVKQLLKQPHIRVDAKRQYMDCTIIKLKEVKDA